MTLNKATAYRCYQLLINGVSSDLPITISTFSFNKSETRFACALLRKNFPDICTVFFHKNKKVVLMNKKK